MIITKLHHGFTVYVDTKNNNSHRQNCLCYKCSRFHPNEDKNCKIAQLLYDVNRLHGLVTPVYECPEFQCEHETVLMTKGRANPVGGYDDFEDALVCMRCGKEIKTVEQLEEEQEDFTEVF